jgi:hypothetical protein
MLNESELKKSTTPEPSHCKWESYRSNGFTFWRTACGDVRERLQEVCEICCGANFAPTAPDLPRAAADDDARKRAREIIGNVNNYAEESTGELSISAFGPLAERIAAALATPRVTEGLTVEAALAQIREIFPHSWAQLTVNANYDRNSYKLHVPDFKRVKEFVCPTLESLVNDVHVWAQSRAEREGERS